MPMTSREVEERIERYERVAGRLPAVLEIHAQAGAGPGQPLAEVEVLRQEVVGELALGALQDRSGRRVARSDRGRPAEAGVQVAARALDRLLRGGAVGPFDLDIQVVAQRQLDRLFQGELALDHANPHAPLRFRARRQGPQHQREEKQRREQRGAGSAAGRMRRFATTA